MCDLRLSNPFSMLVAGSSQTGKTLWVREMLKKANRLYSQPPGAIYFFVREWQSLFDGIASAKIHLGMPDMAFLKTISHSNATIVIDDLIHHVTSETAELFTVGCSRYGVNIIFITQNLFDKNPFFRTISLNCKYFCIRKNPRDSSSIMHFARQVMPSNLSFMKRVYHDVTNKKAYSYIFFDASQNVPEGLRLRTNVLGENGQPPQCFSPGK